MIVKISKKINQHNISFIKKNDNKITNNDFKYAVINLQKIFDKMFLKFESLENNLSIS